MKADDSKPSLMILSVGTQQHSRSITLEPSKLVADGVRVLITQIGGHVETLINLTPHDVERLIKALERFR